MYKSILHLYEGCPGESQPKTEHIFLIFIQLTNQCTASLKQLLDRPDYFWYYLRNLR